NSNLGLYAGSSTNEFLTVTSAGNVQVATLTASSLVMSDSNRNLASVVLGTGLSLSGRTLNATNAFTGSGTNGQVAYWTSASNITSAADLLNNGSVVGINATSASYSLTVQGAPGVAPLNVTSSSG